MQCKLAKFGMHFSAKVTRVRIKHATHIVWVLRLSTWGLLARRFLRRRLRNQQEKRDVALHKPTASYIPRTGCLKSPGDPKDIPVAFLKGNSSKTSNHE